VDFGKVVVLEPDNYEYSQALPSKSIALEKLMHLDSMQSRQLLAILDDFPSVFSDRPGLCTLVQHTVDLLPGYTPRRLRAYRVPYHYQDQVNEQVSELLQRGFIEPSTSPQASPLVIVRKAPDANGVRKLRLAVDYRYVNKFTVPTVSNIGDIGELIQTVGQSRYISVFDANSGYHQTLVQESDRWLTSFVCDKGQFQWLRTPFGMRNSGTTFVRALHQVLEPVHYCTKAYIDDMAVHSDNWQQHLVDVRAYLCVMQRAGFTLGIKKCEFAKPQLKYIGHLIGSWERRVDPAKTD